MGRQVPTKYKNIMAAHMDRLKLVVVGDSGVGKSSFIQGIVNQEPHHYPHSTIGCSVEVLEYAYTGHHGHRRNVFLEFWEVGGARGHRDSRNVFYANPNGLVLVHDLTNRKSFHNLKKWVEEVWGEDRQELTGVSVRGKEKYHNDYALTSAVTNTVGRSVPVLVVGTRDGGQGHNGGEHSNNNRSAFHIGLTEESDIFFCDMNSLVQTELVSTSSKWTTLNSFFEKVVEKRFYPGGRNLTQDSEYWRGGRKR